MRISFTAIILFILLPVYPLLAGKVEGTITNQKGELLAFCNVYVNNSQFACASNENGFYSLYLPEGNFTITFQYIGYKKKEVSILSGPSPLTLNITLEEDLKELEEIVVRSDKEDPAYAVMRNAIERREKHLKEISAYSCDVYIKGLQKLTDAPDKILGIELNTVLDVDTNNTGIIYLSESQSTFYYQYPDKSKEIMHASVVSGNSQQFSWNDAASMQMNFYENLETLEGFSQRGFVSPVADNALFFYTYHLISNTFEKEHEIFKIAVTPKRATDPVYSGIIYITSDDYRFTGIQLQLVKANGLEFIDTFRVEQEYYYTDDTNLTLLSNKFNFNYTIFGISGYGYFHAFYKNYNLQPAFSKNFFGPEVTKIEDNANKKDSVFWESTRPVQLTEEEKKDYQKKNSLLVLKETEAYMDSADRAFNRFSAAALLRGYIYRNTSAKWTITTNPVFDMLQYNTIEGYLINPKIRFRKELKNKDVFSVTPNFRIETGKNRVLANGIINWMYDQRNSASFNLRGGSTITQFNETGIPPLVNTAYSLLYETNYGKIYRNDYAELRWSRELFNGFYCTPSLSYYYRTPMKNIAHPVPWIDYDDKSFTPNTFPLFTDTTAVELPVKTTIACDFRYVIRQKYISQPDEKYILEARYPVITLHGEWAIPGIFHSAADYAFLSIGVSDNIALGLPGNLQYSVKGGGFIMQAEIPVPDQQYFNGNETIFAKLSENAFFMLPYYAGITSRYFSEMHVQWHTEGFLFRKLPGFKQTKFEPVFSFNYLTTDTLRQYMEIGFGVEHIFKIARADIAWSPVHTMDNENFNSLRFLIGIGF